MVNPRRLAWQVGLWLLAGLALLLAQDVWRVTSQVQEVAYSEFEEALAQGRFDEVTVGNEMVTGHLKDARGGKTLWISVRVDPTLAAHLQRFGVRYGRVIERSLSRDLGVLLLAGLLVVSGWLVVRRARAADGGLRRLLLPPPGGGPAPDAGVRLADVADLDELRPRLAELVECLRPAEAGGRLPRGLLLVGPPGTGKALLARAIAGEAGVPLFSARDAQAGGRLRPLLEQARRRAPALVLVEDLDAPAGADGAPLQDLLAALDAARDAPRLLVVGTAQRLDALDPRLLRVGRFDERWFIDLPGRRARADILARQLRRIAADPRLTPEEVAALTPGLAGAELAGLVDAAARAAGRRRGESVTLADFRAALGGLAAGPPRAGWLLDEQDRRTVACHEMGHALVALCQPGGEEVRRIAVVGASVGDLRRGPPGGRLAGHGELQARLVFVLAGRAAEQLLLGEASTHADDDLAAATALAREMVMRHGMDEHVGPLALEPADGAGNSHAAGARVSESLQRLADDGVRHAVVQAQERALVLLKRHRAVLESGTWRLVEKEALDAADIDALRAELARGGAAPAPAPPQPMVSLSTTCLTPGAAQAAP